MIDEKSYKQTSNIIRQEGKKVAKFLGHFPSENELRLQALLDSNHFRYKFQKVFFKSIKGMKGCAESYYIAQFWLPKKRLFIEVEPGKRLKKVKDDNLRTFDALEVFPKAQCIKLSKNELDDAEFIDNFIKLIK